ncbi:MAG: PAS domain S-box protein [Deltaproteobacteria bacterium]|jgi:PAS domain S-box-containing protein|nr:PAS domain S-box protein [Deltaproteobacteria bacterium]
MQDLKQAGLTSRIGVPVSGEIARDPSGPDQFDKEDVCRLIVEKAYEGIIVAQNDRVCFVNKRMSDLTGYPQDELLSMSGIDLVHPDDKEWVADRLNRRLNGENVENTYPVRVITKKEEVKWVQATAIEISWEGRPAVLGFLADISAQKQAETALKESEMRYRNIVDNAVVGVYETNVPGDIIYVNDAILRFFGYDSPDEAIGQNVEIAYKDLRDRDVFVQILKKTGYVENFELELVTKTGRSKSAIVTAVLNGDKISGMLLDISTHKKDQEALTTLINATHDIALLIEPDGTVAATNSRAAKTLSKTPKELIGKCIYKFFPHDLAKYRKEYLEDAMLKKRPAQHIEKHRGYYYITNIFPILDSQDNVRYLAIFVKNITGLKKIEAALRDSEKQYRNIVDTALIGVYETSLDGEIGYVNEAMARIFGFDSSAEMIGTGTAVRYTNTKDRKILIRNLKKYGRAENFEIEAVTRSGETKKVMISAVLDGDKITGMIMDITDRKIAEEELKKAHDKLEYRVAERTKELKRQTVNLAETNTALKVLLKKRNEDKSEMEEKIITNVKELVLPYLEKVKRKVKDKKLQSYLDVLETNLSNIVSPFSNKLSSKYMNLTSAEIEVADLVKHGKSTKEIADLLNVSIKTVETHRVNMRKKLGITNRKVNLRTYLLSLA